MAVSKTKTTITTPISAVLLISMVMNEIEFTDTARNTMYRKTDSVATSFVRKLEFGDPKTS